MLNSFHFSVCYFYPVSRSAPTEDGPNMEAAFIPGSDLDARLLVMSDLKLVSSC